MTKTRLQPPAIRRRPIAPWAVGFDRAWLRGDLVAGLALGFVLIPQGMAYADLAGMPLVAGLYATILAVIGYAILGSSRQLVVGPDSSTSTLVAASVVAMVGVNAAPERYVAIATGLAVASGAILILAAILKLGSISSLISRPVLVGYLNGLAITIIVGQLPKILGYKAHGDGPVQQLGAIIEGLGQTLATPLIVGIISLVVLLGLPRIAPRIPAALVVIVGAIVLVPVLGLDQGQLALVGQIRPGSPPSPSRRSSRATSRSSSARPSRSRSWDSRTRASRPRSSRAAAATAWTRTGTSWASVSRASSPGSSAGSPSRAATPGRLWPSDPAAGARSPTSSGSASWRSSSCSRRASSRRCPTRCWPPSSWRPRSGSSTSRRSVPRGGRNGAASGSR